MSDRTAIPNNSRHDLVTFDLIVNGSALDSGYQVMSIAVTKEVNRLPTADVVLRDGEAANRKFALSDTEDFIPGKKSRSTSDGTESTLPFSRESSSSIASGCVRTALPNSSSSARTRA